MTFFKQISKKKKDPDYHRFFYFREQETDIYAYSGSTFCGILEAKNARAQFSSVPFGARGVRAHEHP